MAPDTARYRTIDTFAGPFFIRMTAAGLSTGWDRHGETDRHDPGLVPDVADRLERYFAGEDVDFDDVPTPAGSGFFRRCWAACRTIPRGQTRTYGDLAVMAGSPRGSRAAGQAMRRNPLGVIVPCHRVLASTGVLHGYAGNQDLEGRELATKRALLELEGALRPCVAPSLFQED